MNTTTDWPYDADQHDPLTALRIPVTSSHPTWVYLVAFDRDSAARPTDLEARQIASYIDYQRDWFNDTWKARLLEHPLDVDGGHNTTILHKYADDTWAYRRRTWYIGPMFWPPPSWSPDHRALSLVEVLDHKHTIGDDPEPMPRWRQWKAAHREVFAATEVTK